MSEGELTTNMAEDCNVLARFIGRHGSSMTMDLDALEAVTRIKFELLAAGRFHDSVCDCGDWDNHLEEHR